MATQRMTIGGKTMYRDSENDNMRTTREKSNKKKGADNKACWDGYRYGGTVNGRDICTKVKR